MQITPAPPRSALQPHKPVDPLMVQARALEASFLSEMLAYAGMGKAQDALGGGIGEEQFASFLRQEQAERMVEKGGIGLAEKIFRSMTGGAENVG
jgi:Rod binding domain-containing protein